LTLAPTAQRGRGGWSDVSMTRGFGVMFERVGHADELAIVPGASEELEIDRLVVIVESRRKDDRRNAVGCARRVAATEARPRAASVVHADLAQQARVNDGVNASMIGACSVHPHFDDILTRYAI